MVLVAAQICDDKKATDTRILELDPADAGFTDFFLITSATNNRQTGAIADEIELRMKREFGTYAKSVEGRRAGEWILLDYVDFVVHIFTEQTREFYDIERLRKSARAMDTAELTAELRQKTEAARRKVPGTKSLPAGTAASIVLAGTAASIVLAGPAAPARKSAKKALAKAAAKQAPAKAAGKKNPAKKAPAKAAAKKAAKKSPAKKAPAKKAAKKSAALVKTAGKPAHAPSVEDTSRRALTNGAPTRKQLPPPRP